MAQQISREEWIKTHDQLVELYNSGNPLGSTSQILEQIAVIEMYLIMTGVKVNG